MNGKGRGVLAAVAFLTRIPTGGHPFEPGELRSAAAFFPLVGLLLGAALGALHRALWPLGSFADAALVLAASLLATGGLHEDGLADTFDAFGGASDRARFFEVLKDSRIGAFGACALVVSIVVRVALMDRLGRSCVWALPLVGCAARVVPCWQMRLLPYIDHDAAKSAALARVGTREVVVATAWLAGAVAGAILARLASPWRAAIFCIALAGAGLITGRRYLSRVGGVTGDLLGATEQIGEIVGLAVLAWAGQP